MPNTIFVLQARQKIVVDDFKSKTSTLHQKGKVFLPKLLVIYQGDTLDLTNDDVVYHNVFSMSEAKRFDLGLYPHGDHREVRFDKLGLVRIFCAIHPDMFAQVLVVHTPWHAVLKEGEQVVWKDVPKGDYDLSMWDTKEKTFKVLKGLSILEKNMRVSL
ncbi:MAG: hypothetical protein Q9M28_09730 [Mariprofundaceae bacterium]|nr:hypothetical protein [Mariprofundaceae bacterium]